MRKLLLWLAMVIAMVALILGGTAAFLSSRTGEKDLRRRRVTFGDTALTPTGGIGPSRAGRQSKQALPEPHQPDRAKAGHFYRYRAPAGAAGLGHPRRCDHHRARRHGLDRRYLHLQHSIPTPPTATASNYCKAYHQENEPPPTPRAGTPTAPGTPCRWPHRDPEQRPRRPGQRGGAVSHRYSGW